MPISRRLLLAATPLLAVPRLARAEDPRLAERAVGKPDAPVTVMEFFSLTCPHCARFARDVMPRVHKDLIDPGKLRMVYRDFPLDQLALTAAMVARALPPDRYEPFAFALLASQDRWAFARGVNSTEQLARMAALAGMSRSTFDATIADEGLRTAIVTEQDEDEKKYQVDSTPTFIINGPNARNQHQAGELTYETFAGLVTKAAAA